MFVEIFLFLVVLFVFFYRHCTKQFNFFKLQGIPYAQPSFPFGSSNSKAALTGKVNIFTSEKLLVENEGFGDKKVFGYFMMGQPNFVINDQELAKRIMISDFDHFTDLRPVGYDGHTKENKLFNHMFTSMRGEKWKKTRSIFNPGFTGSKLKVMAPHMAKVAAQMTEFIGGKPDEEFEARDLFGKYTIDGLATAGFGLELDSFKEPDNMFRIQALILSGAPGYASNWDIPRIILISTAPALAKLFKVPIFSEKAALFISDIIEKAVKHRRQTGYKRNDLIDIALEGLGGEFAQALPEEERELMLIGNLLVLFFAGFDTISVTLGITIQRLLEYPEVQEKVFEELQTIFPEGTEEITWDKVHECSYLDMVVQESLRYKNLFPVTERSCTKDYNIPGTDFVIPAGRMVKIYLAGMMEDENNFKNPKEFDPDNFLPENKPNKFAFQAFGQGPRACIGYRFAMFNMKMGLISILRHYRVVMGEKSNRGEIELDPNVVFGIKGGIWFKTEKRA